MGEELLQQLPLAKMTSIGLTVLALAVIAAVVHVKQTKSNEKILLKLFELIETLRRKGD